MCGSDSIFLIAFSTEGTGPKTTDPTFPSALLLGQPGPDKPPPRSVPLACSRDSRRVDPSFSPVDKNPRRTLLGFGSPMNIQTAVSLSERAVFQGIGRQF